MKKKINYILVICLTVFIFCLILAFQKKSENQISVEELDRLYNMTIVSSIDRTSSTSNIELEPALINTICSEEGFITAIHIVNNSTKEFNAFEIGWYVIKFNQDNTYEKITNDSYQKYKLDILLLPGKSFEQRIHLSLISIARELYNDNILPMDTRTLDVRIVLYINQVYYDANRIDYLKIELKNNQSNLTPSSVEPDGIGDYCTGGNCSSLCSGGLTDKHCLDLTGSQWRCWSGGPHRCCNTYIHACGGEDVECQIPRICCIPEEPCVSNCICPPPP